MSTSFSYERKYVIDKIIFHDWLYYRLFIIVYFDNYIRVFTKFAPKINNHQEFYNGDRNIRYELEIYKNGEKVGKTSDRCISEQDIKVEKRNVKRRFTCNTHKNK